MKRKVLNLQEEQTIGELRGNYTVNVFDSTSQVIKES